MTQLSVELSNEQLAALRRCARERHVTVPELIREALDTLLATSGAAGSVDDDFPSAADLAAIAQQGGAFDWLADEPDLYDERDGEPL